MLISFINGYNINIGNLSWDFIQEVALHATA